MLIFYYAGRAISGVGVLVAIAGGCLAVRYLLANRLPPRSEEEEQGRNRLGRMALAISLIGLLACGVGVLFM